MGLLQRRRTQDIQDIMENSFDYSSKEFKAVLKDLNILNDEVSRHLENTYGKLGTISRMFKEYYGYLLEQYIVDDSTFYWKKINEHDKIKP